MPYDSGNTLKKSNSVDNLRNDFRANNPDLAEQLDRFQRRFAFGELQTNPNLTHHQEQSRPSSETPRNFAPLSDLRTNATEKQVLEIPEDLSGASETLW